MLCLVLVLVIVIDFGCYVLERTRRLDRGRSCYMLFCGAVNLLWLGMMRLEVEDLGILLVGAGRRECCGDFLFLICPATGEGSHNS
jgi:hypothetical protein